MKTTVSLKTAFAALAAALMTGGAFAAEAHKAEGGQATEAQAEAEKVQPKKRRPKKAATYAHYKAAEETAKAWNQPIVAFVEIDGDKAAQHIKMKTFGVREFAEFADANFVFYHCKIPQKIEKRRGRRAPPKRDKNAPLKPDYDELKKEDSLAVSRINGSNRAPAYPLIAIISPEGSVKYTMALVEEEASLAKFVEELKVTFDQEKWPLLIPPKFQKALDLEAKKKAALEKRAKK